MPALCVFASLFVLAPVSADDEGQSPVPASAAEVIVTAPRTDVPLKENPAATTVVTEETIERSVSKSIGAEEALKLVPGVKVDNQADGERVHLSIRGQGLLTERGIRGVKVLLDGLPLNDPSGFAPDLFDVDWAAVKRVEVFRGPASALWGGGAAGGILNITTRDGADARGASGEVTLGTDAFWKVFGEAGGTSGPVQYRVSGSRMMGDGYRQHTAYYGTNLYGKFGFAPSASTRLTGVVAGTSYFNENAEGLNETWLAEDRTQANPDALTFNEYQLTQRFTVGFSGETTLGPADAFTYSAYYRQTSWTESVPSTVQHRRYESPGAFLQYTHRLVTGTLTHELSAGVDLDGQTIGDTRRPNLGGAQEGAAVVADQTIDQWGVGLHLFDRVTITKEWSAMAGVRWDRIHNALDDHLRAGGVDLSGERNFEKPTARVGVAWNPRADLGLYASWGQGFLPPATEELANNPAHLGGFNESLVPSTSDGGEVGARGTLTPAFSYDAALFHLATENDFGRYRVPGRPLETFYGNLGSTKRWGVEALVGWYPVEMLSAQLAYTWSHFEYDEVASLFGSFSGTKMPNAPEHQLYLDVEARPVSVLVVGGSCELQTRSYVDPSNASWAGGYTLFHLRAAYRFLVGKASAEATLAVRNLTGKEYIAFTEPDPDGNSYQPAPTRQFFGGVRVHF